MESSASAGRVASAVLDPRRWQALALLCGAFFMVLLDGTITIVALPSIGAGLRFSEQGLQWVLSAYALTFGGLLLLGGRAADLLGRRRVFMAGAVFFTTASLLCGLLRESRAALTRRSYDPAGALTITGALVLLLYAVAGAPGADWGDVRTIPPFAGSAVLVAAFALIESRHRAPPVPLRIFRCRPLAGADALTILIGAVACSWPVSCSSRPRRSCAGSPGRRRRSLRPASSRAPAPRS